MFLEKYWEYCPEQNEPEILSLNASTVIAQLEQCQKVTIKEQQIWGQIYLGHLPSFFFLFTTMHWGSYNNSNSALCNTNSIRLCFFNQSIQNSNQNQVEKSLKVHKKTAVWRRHLFIVQILKSLKLNVFFFSRESEII